MEVSFLNRGYWFVISIEIICLCFSSRSGSPNSSDRIIWGAFAKNIALLFPCQTHWVRVSRRGDFEFFLRWFSYNSAGLGYYSQDLKALLPKYFDSHLLCSKLRICFFFRLCKRQSSLVYQNDSKSWKFPNEWGSTKIRILLWAKFSDLSSWIYSN